MDKLLISEIEALNKKVEVLNKKRQESIGRQNAAKEQFGILLGEYNRKYQMNIDINTIETEYERVKAELTKQFQELKQSIHEIENGIQPAPSQQAATVIPQAAAIPQAAVPSTIAQITKPTVCTLSIKAPDMIDAVVAANSAKAPQKTPEA